MSLTMQDYANKHYGERTYTSLQAILDDPHQLLTDANDALPRPPGGGLEDILSASRYPQALMQPYHDPEPEPPRRKRKASASNQLYGGLVFAQASIDSNQSSSAEQEHPPTKKERKMAKRASPDDANDQNESKKQRGRPRLDTHDETAAERRRTQIRLAQRAYRHRKETTISALKERVSNLHDTIDQMNKTFLTLHDNMVDAGILTSHYALGRQLQAATEDFVALSKIAASDSDDEDEKIADLTKDASAEPEPEPERRKRSAAKGAPASATVSSSRPTRKSARNTNRGPSFDQVWNDADADMEEVTQGIRHNTNNSPLFALSQAVYGADDTSNLHGLNDLMSFNASVPELLFPDDDDLPLITLRGTSDKQSLQALDKYQLERPLKPAYNNGSYTYSFQETTFARRLHRMCLERAFRNLTNPAMDPGYIQRVFRFTFTFSNRKRMLQRFQEMLKRKAGESLENWNVPFFRIGGAGTHFPRRDDEGNPIYPPNMVSAAKAFVGPQPHIEVETPRSEASINEMLENIGFGGEWYDSHDVEEYLKTKGIFLDGQSSFVEVDRSVLPLVKAGTHSRSRNRNSDATMTTASSTTRSPLESLAGVRTPNPPLLSDLADPYMSRDLGELFASTGTSTSMPLFKDADNPWAEFTGYGGVQNSPPEYMAGFNDLSGRRASPVMFDVEQFLENMVEDSACLGRAPGFRKETIDNALMMNVQEGF
ncbi:hypothetical protein EDD36DRAFT_422403 [Exophiala viscosa]|uniref:BZIP domain-containing protein n=1 Tax=Exophiala viscosa TaxID=2486360 RepID=A0AAN6DMR3_9EURO|nr:hypothetical protein EDD36DRAFT_422403 [Exophiala viscosa]